MVLFIILFIILSVQEKEPTYPIGPPINGYMWGKEMEMSILKMRGEKCENSASSKSGIPQLRYVYIYFEDSANWKRLACRRGRWRLEKTGKEFKSKWF
jgi:hypothetical protein